MKHNTSNGWSSLVHFNFAVLRRRALMTTEREEKAMAAEANIGWMVMPQGMRAPAAIGMSMAL